VNELQLLVERARNGERGAFGELVDHYMKKIDFIIFQAKY